MPTDEEGDTSSPPPIPVDATDTEESQPSQEEEQQPKEEGVTSEGQENEVQETRIDEDHNDEAPQPPASSRSSLSAPRRGHTQDKPGSANTDIKPPDTAEGSNNSSLRDSADANPTTSPLSTYRGAIVRADDDDEGGNSSNDSSLTTVVQRAIDMYQSILGEYQSDTRTAGHTRAVLNTLHRAAAELGLPPNKGITDVDQSSSALVLASMLPIAGPPPTADDMKYNRAIADTFYFYTIKNAYIPHGNGDVTFDVIEAARHQLPFAGIWKMSKDLSLVPHLVNKEEVLECFRYACKGDRCLNEQQFRTFLCNLGRIGLSRPPHNVPIEDTMKELCRRYLIDGLDKMRRFGGDIVPPLSARKPLKGKRRPAGRVIRQQQQPKPSSSPRVASSSPPEKRPLLVKAGRLRLLQPRKGASGAARMGNWPLHLLKPGGHHHRGKDDNIDDLEALNEKERRIMDMLDRNEDARMERALHRQAAQDRSGAAV